MTGFVNAEGNPLSVVTVASLADQGYAVNRFGADPFSLTLALRSTFTSGRGLTLKNDIFRIPVRRVDARGRVVDLLRR